MVCRGMCYRDHDGGGLLLRRGPKLFKCSFEPLPAEESEKNNMKKITCHTKSEYDLFVCWARARVCVLGVPCVDCEVAVVDSLRGVLGLLSHVSAQLTYSLTKVGEPLLDVVVLSLCGRRTETYMETGEKKTRNRDASKGAGNVKPTCVCDQSQHQHSNCEVQSHLGCDSVVRKGRDHLFTVHAIKKRKQYIHFSLLTTPYASAPPRLDSSLY